jgi:molybdopterin molybdotransferase
MAIKPGRPLAFGTVRRPDGTSALILGLPGNPVSSFVTYLLCVATVLRALQGMDWRLPRGLAMRADFDWPRPDKRREFMRARLNPEGGLELFPNQSSGVLTSAVWADGLVDNPAGTRIARGDTVRFLPLTDLVTR